MVRVRVMRVRDPKHPAPALRIGSAGQWIMARGQADASHAAHSTALQGPLEIDMTDRGWSIVDAAGFRASVSPHEAIELSPLADDPTGTLSVSPTASATSATATTNSGSATTRAADTTRQYRGTLRLISRHDLDDFDDKTGEVARASRAFDIINDIPLESYLPGVLAGELYPNWKLETYAAQAVAARSFACTEAAVFAGRRHYDVSNNAASQMYLGEVAQGRAHDAVQATRGKALRYQGLLVSGYYSSCCGGLAASAVDAIGSNAVNDIAPLRGRTGSDVCTDAPVYHWTQEQPLDAVTRRIAAFARERGLSNLAALQRLAAVETVLTNPNGRPTRMALIDDQQQRAELSAEDFRRAVNWGGSNADGSIKPPERELRSSNVRVSIVGATAVFDGNGFGHGVGLCQHGAEALARAGTAHEDILRWYYPDIEIVKAYA